MNVELLMRVSVMVFFFCFFSSTVPLLTHLAMNFSDALSDNLISL